MLLSTPTLFQWLLTYCLHCSTRYAHLHLTIPPHFYFSCLHFPALIFAPGTLDVYSYTASALVWILASLCVSHSECNITVLTGPFLGYIYVYICIYAYMYMYNYIDLPRLPSSAVTHLSHHWRHTLTVLTWVVSHSAPKTFLTSDVTYLWPIAHLDPGYSPRRAHIHFRDAILLPR